MDQYLGRRDSDCVNGPAAQAIRGADVLSLYPKAPSSARTSLGPPEQLDSLFQSPRHEDCSFRNLAGLFSSDRAFFSMNTTHKAPKRPLNCTARPRQLRGEEQGLDVLGNLNITCVKQPPVGMLKTGVDFFLKDHPALPAPATKSSVQPARPLEPRSFNQRLCPDSLRTWLGDRANLPRSGVDEDRANNRIEQRLVARVANITIYTNFVDRRLVPEAL
ncbi:hypothetical protein C8R47DRAFT_1063028 [Mycena vitilis]|nr:hypothetical protein C8R47DRAFT_1063028 [Mycena vitilis]